MKYFTRSRTIGETVVFFSYFVCCLLFILFNYSENKEIEKKANKIVIIIIEHQLTEIALLCVALNQFRYQMSSKTFFFCECVIK